jgi:hypothetical protein
LILGAGLLSWPTRFLTPTLDAYSVLKFNRGRDIPVDDLEVHCAGVTLHLAHKRPGQGIVVV